MRDGDIAAVYSIKEEDWKLEVEVPKSGKFFVEFRAVVQGEAHVFILIDGEIVSQQWLANTPEIPGYRPLVDYTLVKKEPGTKVKVSAQFIGIFVNRPYLLVTENYPSRL